MSINDRNGVNMKTDHEHTRETPSTDTDTDTEAKKSWETPEIDKMDIVDLTCGYYGS